MTDSSIGAGQYHLLHIISKHEGISQQEIAEWMNIDKANVARGITKLEKSRLVTREKNSRDNRVFNLYLTPSGKSLVPKLMNTLCRISDICSEELSPAEGEELIRLLEKVEKTTSCKINDLRKRGEYAEK